ncbi:hypothetical protein EYF80_056314 [Liparis tanakae]|uniref:Uncharacterized protein n=1 Tax=Liparis tanakae TaxID=230148 RepID=A0A4Z2EYT2_9TELE|nr:hypothetical protein EYF80_056314 [Liparis tanakae]
MSLEPYPEGLAVGPDVGGRPVGQALDMQGFPLVEAALLRGGAPVLQQAVHLQQPAGRQRGLNTHPAGGGHAERVRQLDFEKLVCLDVDVLEGERPGVGPVPGWRVHAKVFLVDGVESNEVLHGRHVQVDEDDVLHAPASAVQLTWTQRALSAVGKQPPSGPGSPDLCPEGRGCQRSTGSLRSSSSSCQWRSGKDNDHGAKLSPPHPAIKHHGEHIRPAAHQRPHAEGERTWRTDVASHPGSSPAQLWRSSGPRWSGATGERERATAGGGGASEGEQEQALSLFPGELGT